MKQLDHSMQDRVRSGASTLNDADAVNILRLRRSVVHDAAFPKPPPNRPSLKRYAVRYRILTIFVLTSQWRFCTIFKQRSQLYALLSQTLNGKQTLATSKTIFLTKCDSLYDYPIYSITSNG